MVELAVRDGFAAPADLPRGDCIMTTLADGSIRIDRADPRILISAECLDLIASGQETAGHPCPWPVAVLDTTDCCDCMMQDDYTLAVLKINGVNQQVIYRITDYVPAINAYIGQWPD